MSKTFYRTHTCGELNETHVGHEVTLAGWIDTLRDHGGVTFFDLRDRYGKTQILWPSDKIQAKLKIESTVQIRGKVGLRPPGTENSKLSTGKIEIEALEANFLGACETTPFEVTKSQETNEDLRMTYRYLDLRNPAVQKNLFARHKVYQSLRRTLDRHDFIEVETPILTKSTPEGARDYLVPSRVNQGEFYALPQSPQLFKQILMVSGFDRYFQIAKCFRDEDLRADRQPEFTQLDMEMSYIGQEDLFVIVEDVLKNLFIDVFGVGANGRSPLQTPFPRLSYQDAMARYGSDKPDLRFGMEFVDISDVARASDFKVFKSVADLPTGTVIGISIPKAEASRKEIDTLTEFAKSEGAGGLANFKVENGTLEAPIAKFFKPEQLAEIAKRFQAQNGDLIVFAADETAKARKVLGAVRLYAARWKNLIPKNSFHFSWVTDFPLFKWNDEEKRWESEHHPFTSPHLEDWDKHKPSGQLEKIRSSAYDLVLNGNEIASGSIRIHRRDLQREIFKTIGLDEKEAENRFGFLLKAFEFGPPPHGGIALGIDRVIAILLGQSSIREVIAFPKNQKAVDPMTDAPSPVEERQLKELGIKIR